MTTPPAPTPAPEPIPPVQPTSAGWWQWLLGMILSLAIGVGVLIGHPFNSEVITAVIPSVSLIAASLMAAFGLHGQTQVKVHQLALARSLADERAAHARLQAALAGKGKAA